MIIGYDRNPSASVDQKVQSLMESVQMALNEHTTDISKLSNKVDNLPQSSESDGGDLDPQAIIPYKWVELSGTTDTSGNMSPSCDDYSDYRPVAATLKTAASQCVSIYTMPSTPIYGYHISGITSAYSVYASHAATVIVLLVHK